MKSKQYGSQGYKRVFYAIEQIPEVVPADSARDIGAGEIYEVLIDVIAQPKNFIGFIDDDDTTIQFYVESIDKIWVDIPMLSKSGSYGSYISNQEFIDFINEMVPPYSNYVSVLGLKFSAW